MSGIRFFSGGRDADEKKRVAKEMMRLGIEKRAKMDGQERFKFMMERKMAENRNKVRAAKMSNRPMSARAEKALKDMAAKKAAKQAKQLRKMVIITPKTYMNGKLTKKGDLFDLAG